MARGDGIEPIVEGGGAGDGTGAGGDAGAAAAAELAALKADIAKREASAAKAREKAETEAALKRGEAEKLYAAEKARADELAAKVAEVEKREAERAAKIDKANAERVKAIPAEFKSLVPPSLKGEELAEWLDTNAKILGAGPVVAGDPPRGRVLRESTTIPDEVVAEAAQKRIAPEVWMELLRKHQPERLKKLMNVEN